MAYIPLVEHSRPRVLMLDFSANDVRRVQESGFEAKRGATGVLANDQGCFSLPYSPHDAEVVFAQVSPGCFSAPTTQPAEGSVEEEPVFYDLFREVWEKHGWSVFFVGEGTEPKEFDAVGIEKMGVFSRNRDYSPESSRERLTELIIEFDRRHGRREAVEFPDSVRNILLQRLRERYSTERIRAVAILLWRYIEKYEPWPDMANLERAQQFTAFSFLAPERASEWLEINKKKENSHSDNQAWYVAMLREQAIIEPPKKTSQGLLVFLSGKMSSAYGERNAIRTALAKVPNVRVTGFEELVAAGTPTREKIMAEVARSDIYLGLFGAYYGIGGTDNEYRVARDNNKICLVYFTNDETRLPQARYGGHRGGIRTLETLKGEGGPNQTVKIFNDTTQLVDLVLSDINKIISGEKQDSSDDSEDLLSKESAQKILSSFDQENKNRTQYILAGLNIRQLQSIETVASVMANKTLPERLVELLNRASQSLWLIIEVLENGGDIEQEQKDILVWLRRELSGQIEVGGWKNIIPFIPWVLLQWPALRYSADLSWTWDELVKNAALDAQKIGSKQKIGETPSNVEETSSVRSQFKNLAKQYEDLRLQMPGGSERTQRMWEIVFQLQKLVEQQNSTLLVEFIQSQSPGERLVAVVMLQLHPSTEYLSWLAERFQIDKPFIQYQAGVALRDAALQLDTNLLPRVEEALVQASTHVPQNDVNGHKALLQKALDALNHRSAQQGGLISKSERQTENQFNLGIVELINRQEGDQIYQNTRDEIIESNKQAEVYRSQNRFAEAESLFAESLKMCRQIGDRQNEAITLNHLGQLYQDEKRWGEAEYAYQSSLEIFRELGARHNEENLLNNLGIVYASQGRWAEAEVTYQQSLDICRQLDNKQGEAETLTNLATTYASQGRWKEAEALYQRTLDFFRENGNRKNEGQALANLGEINLLLKDWSRARNIFEHLVDIYQDIGDLQSQSEARYKLGFVYQNQHNWQRAAAAFANALSMYRELGDKAGEGRTLKNLGNVYQFQSRWSEAEHSYARCLNIYRELGNRSSEADALFSLGVAYASQSRWQEAKDIYDQCLAIFLELNDRSSEAQTLYGIGLLYEAQGNESGALDMFEQSLTIQHTLGDKDAQSQIQRKLENLQKQTQPNTNTMQFTGQQLQQLQQALLNAFPSRDALAQMLQFGMDISLSHIAADGALSNIVFELIRWTQAQGRLEELIEAAAVANSGNPQLKAFIASIQPQLTTNAPTAPPTPVAPPPTQLPRGTGNVSPVPTENSTTQVVPIEVFYSYSHKDEALRAQLETHLSILRRQGYIDEWHDREIRAGDKWAGEIDDHLNSADIILLLISADFLASDYCYDIEMKRALERQDAGEARVIPIILRPTDWHAAPFGKFQALPRDAKPVVSWSSRDEAFINIAQGLRRVIEDLQKPKSTQN